VPVGLRMNLQRKGHFGQISRSNSLNRTTIRLIRSKNLTQNDFPSLRLPKSDRLQGAQKVCSNTNDKEIWYLTSRQKERNEKRAENVK
jgi:hypothetical protein